MTQQKRVTVTEIEVSDQVTRKEALDPHRSFIVEAPAGSGKTGLLIQRYLSLLGNVERPETVVAMTFTRKAAAEIKQRVIEALERAIRNDTVQTEYERITRELAQAALRKHPDLVSEPSRLQIETIDALCAMLARQMPIVSRFGGFAEVREGPVELYHLATRRALNELAGSDEASGALFRRISLHFDNNISGLENQIARMLERRDQWHEADLSSETDQLVLDFQALLSAAEQKLADVFREHGQVDFTEVSRAAIRALGTADQPTDLLYSLDYRIEHLLVDEFQDTSKAQYELLKALTEQWSEGDGHTLFLVGDPLQSIYGFRDAEVSLFLKCLDRERFESVPLTPLRLTTNFRSTPEIVDWTQSAFGPIMSVDDTAHGGVKLRSSCASRSAIGNCPRVIPFIEDCERETLEVVQLAKPARLQGSVAILVRSRTHLKDILPALRRENIPYEALEIDELKEEQHIRDLISLARAILHPGDRLSWLACLRAPWCGATLADLSALAESEPNRTILELLSDPERIAALSPDGRNRVLRAQAILYSAVQNAGRVPLRDLLEQTWMDLGGPAVLEGNWQAEDVDTFLDVVEEFETAGIIRDFSLLEERLESLYAKPASGENFVQVLTIHRAKGLEFDTVIMPQLDAPPKPKDKELLIWSEHEIAAQPQKRQTDARYQRVWDYLKEKEKHEAKRLFYVGVTRAKNQLFLLGNVKVNNDCTGCKKPQINAFLGMIWNSVERLFETEFRSREPEQQDLFANQSPPPRTNLWRLPANWRSPRLDLSVRWEPEFRTAAASARRITYEWVSDRSRHVGTIVHELLKRIAGDGFAVWNTERLTAFAPTIKSELLRLGVSSSEEPHASVQVFRAISNTLRSERGRWILHAHTEARSEWPVSGRIKDELISGTVDRAFRDEQGRLWIVDFKTSEHAGGRLESFLNEEQRRYRDQLENYATLISRFAAGPILLGLYFPLLDGWREWRFEEEVAIPSNYTGS